MKLSDMDINRLPLGVLARVYAFGNSPAVTITDTSSPFQKVANEYEYDLELEFDAMVSILGKVMVGYAVAESATCVSYGEIYDATNGVRLDMSHSDTRHDASTASLRLRRQTIVCVCDVSQAAGTTVKYQFLVGASVTSKITADNMFWSIDIRRVQG